MPKSVLIRDTTPEERRKIVEDALACGNCDLCGGCDSIGGGRADDFYLPYIEGRKELAQLNREYRRGLQR